MGDYTSVKISSLLLLLPAFLPLGSTEIKPLQGKVISGLYYEETSQFIPYTKVVPVLFEFKLKPEFMKASASYPTTGSFTPVVANNAFQILPRLHCRNDIKYPVLSTMDWYFTCPIMFHLNQFLQGLKDNLTDIYPIPAPSSVLGRSPSLSPMAQLENQKFTNSKVRFDECDSVIEKMWKGVAIRDRDTGFAFYTSILEKCSSMPMHVEDKIPYEHDDHTEHFDRMQSNFVANFYLNSSDPGELINNLVGLQSIQLQSMYFELTRIREAVLSCQNNMIPQSFVKYSKLEKVLLELRPKLLKLRYTMSFASISKLYKIPVADCIFGSNSLIVQILVPVVRSDMNHVLLKVNSPIFLYENRLCKIETTKSENRAVISDDSQPSKYYLYEKTNKMVVATECKPGDLEMCFIADQTSRPMINRCLSATLNQSQSLINTDDVRYYCHLHCEPEPLSDAFSKLIIPLIQRISSSKFVVAVNRITSLLIKCEGKPDEMVTPQDYGAVEISLACGCYLMWHSEKFDARMPCANTVLIRHVVPENMLNRSATYSRNKFYFVSNLGERINSSLVSGHREGIPENYLEVTSEPGIPFESININETLLGPGVGTNSLSLTNQSESSDYGYSSFYKAGCNNLGFPHTLLWIAVGVETMLFLGIALYLYCRIFDMSKKWELREKTSVTYSSAAQLTSIYE